MTLKKDVIHILIQNGVLFRRGYAFKAFFR